MMPAYEVNVTVVVEHDGKPIVYSRTYLPEYKSMDAAEVVKFTPEKLMEQKHKMASDRSSAAGMGMGNRSVQGYRVQVFSSNQRTAKTDAQNVVQQIRSKAPKLPVYVSYQSPFWKVRVGNCETTTEAQQLRNDMKGLFPELASEIYIVKGKVNVE